MLHPKVENFLSLAALGLYVRMREIASVSEPRGFLKVGKKFLAPENLVWGPEPANVRPLLVELLDMRLISMEESEGRRVFCVTELAEAPPDAGAATETILRTDGYRDWVDAYQPSHEWNCPKFWDAALAAGWKADRIVAIARWYSNEQWKKNEKRVRSSEFFRILPELEKAYLQATREERDGKAAWQIDALAKYRRPVADKESRAA